MSVKKVTIAAGIGIFGLSAIGMSQPAIAASFSPDNWETFGDVELLGDGANLSTNALFGDDFSFGDDTEFNFSGNPANFVGFPGALEDFLGLEIGALDMGGFAFQGSALKQTFEVEAGDTFGFDWNFLTNQDFIAFPDYSFITIDDTVTKLADIVDATLPSDPYQFETGVGNFSYTFENAGTYTVGLGAVDINDFDTSSALSVSNVAIASAPDESVPEPSAVLALLAVGLLGLRQKFK